MVRSTLTVTLKSGGSWTFLQAGDELQRAAETGGVAEREKMLRGDAIALAAEDLASGT